MSDIANTRDFDVVGTPEGAKVEMNTSLSRDEIKKRSVHGAGVYFARTIFLTLLAIVAQSVLFTFLSPEQVGIYGIVVTIGGFFTIISDVGLAASLIQKKEEPTVEELRTVFTTQQILAWIVFGLLVLTSHWMMTIGKITTEGYFLAIAFALTFPIVSIKTISSILLERNLQFNGLVTTAIVEAVVFNGALIVLAYKGFGVTSYTIAVLLKAVVGVFVMMGFKRWEIGLAFSWKKFVDLMKVGGGFQLNDMLAKAKDDLFYLSVAFFISPSQFGYLTWARQWSRQPYALTVDNISALTFPAFSRLQHDTALLRAAIEKTVFFVTLISFPMLGGLAVMATPLIHVFPQWMKWEPAILSLALFSASLAFSSFSTPLINTLSAIGKIGETLKMMLFWTISQWVMAPFLLSYFGYQAVPIISMILAISSLFVVLLVKKYVVFSFIDQVSRQAIATTIMVALLYCTQNYWSTSLASFITGIGVGAFTFVALMGILGYEKIKREFVSVLKRR